MTSIRLVIASLLLFSAVGANGRYERIDTADLLNRADTYQGRLVTISGKVCAVNADRKSIQLFETQSRALIDIQLTRLKKAQRSALILNNVRNVSVYGRAESKNGRLVIEAHQVVPGQ
jgi:hypothetical protein